MKAPNFAAPTTKTCPSTALPITNIRFGNHFYNQPPGASLGLGCASGGGGGGGLSDSGTAVCSFAGLVELGVLFWLTPQT